MIVHQIKKVNIIRVEDLTSSNQPYFVFLIIVSFDWH